MVTRPWKGRSSTLVRSEEHTSELQSLRHLVCRLLLEKKPGTSKETTKAGAPGPPPPCWGAAANTSSACVPDAVCADLFFFYLAGAPRRSPFSPSRRSCH